METNNRTKWTEGLRFVQAIKNRAYHEGIKCSPYEAMFGVPMKLGIANSFLPRNLTIKMTNDGEELSPGSHCILPSGEFYGLWQNVI